MKISTVEKIKILLDRKGMTMGDLAIATGQSRQNLSNKFKRNNFSEKELTKIAEVLGCELEIIFKTEDDTKI